MDSEKIKEIVCKRYGEIISFQPIESNNDVAIIETKNDKIVFKANNEKGAFKDNEKKIRSIVGKTRYFRKILYSDFSKKEYGKEFVLFEYVEGEDLLDLIKKGIEEKRLKNISRKIYEFLVFITSFKQSKCGKLGRDNSCSWTKCLLDMHSETTDILLDKINHKYLKEIYDFIISYGKFINKANFSLIPIDLNLKNFLITEKDQIVFLDSGGIIKGDPLLAFGEFLSHTYKTKLGDFFMENISNYNEGLIHFYACFMNANVLAYISKNSNLDLDISKPWGNSHTFKNLMDVHIDKMESHFPQENI